MITPEELAEVERLDREATSGPWWQGDAEDAPRDRSGERIGSLDEVYSGAGVWVVTEFRREEDARFTARARALLPRLAAAHEELLAKHGALFDAASKLTIAVRSGRGVTEALATLELVLDPEGEEVTGG